MSKLVPEAFSPATATYPVLNNHIQSALVAYRAMFWVYIEHCFFKFKELLTEGFVQLLLDLFDIVMWY